MKFLELIGYGNLNKHLIALKSISDIAFEPNYTSITLNSGLSVNVIEDESTLKEMIQFLDGNIISEKQLSTVWESQQSSGWWVDEDGDELPF